MSSLVMKFFFFFSFSFYFLLGSLLTYTGIYLMHDG